MCRAKTESDRDPFWPPLWAGLFPAALVRFVGKVKPLVIATDGNLAVIGVALEVAKGNLRLHPKGEVRPMLERQERAFSWRCGGCGQEFAG